ncbi:MAG: apolipoprotein N-acyltransferase [Candidatus Velthaea sp.]
MCAFALHLAFPRANQPWVAPVALAGLFASWMLLPPRRAALVGFFSGVLFFALDFTWLGETAGALIAPFGFVFDLIPAMIEAVAFAATAAIVSLAWQRVQGAWVPIVCAAGFTALEWIRSIGMMGAPLYTVGSPFVATPLAPLAAFAGNAGITFAVTFVAAALATYAIDRSRTTALGLAGSIVAVAALTGAAWLAWPARHVAPGTIRVAAVQGNIKQELKWSAPALALAVTRYTAMTASLRAFGPQFVLWPETVISTHLTREPRLQKQFSDLARSMHTILAVGSVEDHTETSYYNSLFFYDRNGALMETYRKRQLVPFIEFLPGPAWLRRLPGANLVSNFGSGTQERPIDPQLGIAPMICWESAFGDLAQSQAAHGAKMFAIATDDAWFGVSDGPYWHAQIASLRAIETGRWIVRAAATGISGIIAPDGTWRARSGLERQEVIAGTIGDPLPTVYSRIGPTPVGFALVLIVFGGFAFARKRAG